MARDFGRPINRIVIHCTATGKDATVPQIIKYWKKNLGWKNPGYHYIIGINGERHILQHLSKTTNGVKGHNWDSVHISWIGGKNKGDEPTEAQWLAMKKLVERLRKNDILGPVPVIGHRDLSPDKDGNGIVEKHEWLKRCPNFEVKEYFTKLGVT